MAKQSVDNKTQELDLPFQWDKIKEMETVIKQIRFRADELCRLRGYAENDLNKLINEGINYAGTTWKDGKYLYLVYPADESGKRVRQYVGSDNDVCQKELDKLDRGQKVLKVKREISELESKMSTVLYYLSMCVR